MATVKPTTTDLVFTTPSGGSQAQYDCVYASESTDGNDLYIQIETDASATLSAVKAKFTSPTSLYEMLSTSYGVTDSYSQLTFKGINEEDEYTIDSSGTKTATGYKIFTIKMATS